MLAGDTKRCISTYLLVLLCLAFTPINVAQAAQSSLSKWLSDDTLPEITRLLSEHPRYQQQRFQIRAGNNNGLSEAIVIVAKSNLSASGDITQVSEQQSITDADFASVRYPNTSVDDLICSAQPQFDYLLRVTAKETRFGRDEVIIELLDATSSDAIIRQWQWRGYFTQSESKQYDIDSNSADGSLLSPWSEQDIDAAANALTHEFICAVRPQIRDQLRLKWPEQLPLGSVFADTANAAKHKLGSYRELGISDEGTNYQISWRLEPFREDIWQVWLTGSPRVSDLEPVQAVTYFLLPNYEVANLTAPVPTEATDTAVRTPVRVPEPVGSAADFLDVTMLDATQSDKSFSRADLEITLRINNRADWPIAYSFTTSGGHFENCIASPTHYRHDRYGLVKGELAGGESEIRRLVIKNTRHRPAPLYGVPKCAGFRDLTAFEAFASQGYRVTDYIRWED
ncbi:MAG: hypothetical protein AAGI44_14140 [Pseudomonadota bacterium]